MHSNNIQLKYGVFGGTFLSTVMNISFENIVYTIIMATIGAVVSFIVSLLLKKVFGKTYK